MAVQGLEWRFLTQPKMATHHECQSAKSPSNPKGSPPVGGESLGGLP